MANYDRALMLRTQLRELEEKAVESISDAIEMIGDTIPSEDGCMDYPKRSEREIERAIKKIESIVAVADKQIEGMG